MSTVTRASGLTIVVPDTYRVEEPGSDTPPTEVPSRGPGRGRVSGPVPMPTAPTGTGGSDSDALISALQDQGFTVVDRVELQPQLEPTPPDGQRRSIGAPIAARQDAEVEIAVGADEDAVLLVEQDGMYSWNVPTGESTPTAGTRTRGRRGATRRITFTIEIRATRESDGPARRGLVSELVYDRVRVYALKFVARVAIGSGARFLERHIRRGLVAMRGLDPSQWTLVNPSDVTLPSDRPARILLFVHGTFSSTIGSFGALCGTPWGQALFSAAEQQYDAILGSDHATLSDDPIVNATELLTGLESLDAKYPPRIDVVSYSRGGLVFRTLVEHLLPRGTLKCRIERGIFVGCTNGGTLLAKADNWHTLVDLYTNIAVGAFRLLTLLPQATATALILKELVSGLGAFVKYLATYATRDLPGLAAMVPDGEFIKTLNSRQPNQPEPGAIAYYAVTSEFEPVIRGTEHQPRELPLRLVTALADGLVDRVMNESNDLVVNTRSMTAIDESIGGYVKDALAFGRTSKVYHTCYFAQPEVVNAIARWLEIPAPASMTRRSHDAEGRSELPPIAAPRDVVVPAAVDTDILVADADTPVTSVAARIERESPSYVVVRRRIFNEWLHYAFRPEEILACARQSHPGVTTLFACALREEDRSDEDAIDGALLQPTVKSMQRPGAPSTTRRRVAMIGDIPIGVIPEADASTDVDLVSLARVAGAPRTPEERAIARRAMPTFTVGTARPLTPPFAPPAPVGPSSTHPVTRGVPRFGSRSGAPSPVAFEAAGPPIEQITCHFLAEMDPEVLLNHTTTIEVMLSREALSRLEGTEAAAGSGTVAATAPLVVQVVPKTNFVLASDAKDRVEVAPPATSETIDLYFDVVAAHPGRGEVWVLVKQHQMTIATLVLRPMVVDRKGASRARRVLAEAEAPPAPPLTSPLDQLNVFERKIGDSIFYEFELEMPSVNVFAIHASPPLQTKRDEYVNGLYKEIEDRYVSHYSEATKSADVAAFTMELQSYGALLFDQLFPREVQDLLWKYRDTLKSIRVVSTEPFIPWEIVHLREPGQPVDTSAPPRFLGQMGLVRWLHNVNGLPPTTLRVREGLARYVIPDYPHPDWKLPQTVNEKLYLEQRFAATPLEPQPGPVQAALTHPGAFDLLHFACHGEAESGAITHARIVLEGRVEGANFVPTHLKASNVETFARLRGTDGVQPLVFLNACQAGRAGYQLTGIGGFAQAFLKAGAGAFVGTLWSVGDQPAFLFGKAFYDAIQNGSTLAEAAVLAREAARTDDATWLAYVVYGHPHAKLSR